MQNKNRNLYKDELILWKETTKNDIRIKNYIDSNDLKNKKFEISKNIKANEHIDKKNKKTLNIKISKNENRAQINSRMQKNFIRGKIRPEATLDLHGYSKSDARVLLIQFIKKNIDLNLRCLLIITGKKKSYFGAKSVLRENLPKWLEEKEVSSMILSHTYASIKDGGDGARYVLLRKKEKVSNEKNC